MNKIFLLILMTFSAYAEEPKVIYQYKKYEKFDLGDLEVKGQLIAPGDLSVRERERRRFELDLYNRADFDSNIKHDINTLR
ncbi:MAG: hypothetical protein K2P81_17885 [Bacteriovoracaceae bacterium]|nr:hypothetical protein [Bacteriovoracaceae bacterium]